MRWSVSLVAEGDREIELEEVVELADAVAGHDGVASGMGTRSYAAQILVHADSSEDAAEKAMAIFTEAVEKARLPSWPIVSVDTIGEEEDMDWYEEIPPGRGLDEEESR